MVVSINVCAEPCIPHRHCLVENQSSCFFSLYISSTTKKVPQLIYVQTVQRHYRGGLQCIAVLPAKYVGVTLPCCKELLPTGCDGIADGDVSDV